MDGISGTVQIFSGGENAERETTQLRPIDKGNQRHRTITVHKTMITRR
jgi:hypothetical protein